MTEPLGICSDAGCESSTAEAWLKPLVVKDTYWIYVYWIYVHLQVAYRALPRPGRVFVLSLAPLGVANPIERK